MCVEITFGAILMGCIIFWNRKRFFLLIKMFSVLFQQQKCKIYSILLIIGWIMLYIYLYDVILLFTNIGLLFFTHKQYLTAAWLLLILINGLLILNTSNAINNLVLLIFFFINSATLLLFTGMKYIGINLILIYLGAILVLLLFVIMLLNATTVIYNNVSFVYNFFLGLLGFKFFLVLWFFLKKSYYFSIKNYVFLINQTTNTYEDVFLISGALYTTQVFSLLITTLVLLIALIVSITLTQLQFR